MVKKEVEVKLSEQAEMLINQANIDRQEFMSFITSDGFSVGGREVLEYMQTLKED